MGAWLFKQLIQVGSGKNPPSSGINHNNIILCLYLSSNYFLFAGKQNWFHNWFHKWQCIVILHYMHSLCIFLSSWDHMDESLWPFPTCTQQYHKHGNFFFPTLTTWHESQNLWICTGVKIAIFAPIPTLCLAVLPLFQALQLISSKVVRWKSLMDFIKFEIVLGQCWNDNNSADLVLK